MAINKEYGMFPSNDGIHKINYVCVYPDNPKAIIQIEHGIAEHIERYIPFATTLAEHGYAVFADDHLGHGKTVVSEDELCWFSKTNGWKNVCNDVWSLHDVAVGKFPNIPFVLMGHSMGSFIVRTVAIYHSEQIDALIISGTGHQAAPVILAGKAVCAVEKARIGSKGRSKLVAEVAFGAYNKKFSPNRTSHDWLTRDEAEVDKYINDPLCGADATVGLFSDMLDGLNIIRQPKHIAKIRKELPIYMFSGHKDPVGQMGIGVKRVYKLFLKSGMKDVSLKLYENGRHELLNGPDRELVIEELLSWLEKIE